MSKFVEWCTKISPSQRHFFVSLNHAPLPPPQKNCASESTAHQNSKFWKNTWLTPKISFKRVKFGYLKDKVLNTCSQKFNVRSEMFLVKRFSGWVFLVNKSFGLQYLFGENFWLPLTFFNSENNYSFAPPGFPIKPSYLLWWTLGDKKLMVDNPSDCHTAQ